MFRRNRGSARIVAGLSVMLLLVLTACSAGQSATPTTPAPVPAPGQPVPEKPATLDEWVVAFSEDVTSLDPGTTSGGSVKWNAQFHIFEPLIGVEGPNLEQVPRLAESWSYPNDTTLEVKLRKNVKFHNGDSFNADDVVYSFDLQAIPPGSGNSDALKSVIKVERVDDFTVRFHTAEPSSSLIQSMAQIMPIVPKSRETIGVEAFSKRPYGTGMFKLAADFVRDQPIQLVANEDYWGGPPMPKKLTFKFLREPSTRVAELLNGTIHLAQNISLPQVEMVKAGAKTDVVASKGTRIIHFSINMERPPFDNVKVRQALNYAINRDVIINNVLLGYGVPLAGLFGPGWKGHSDQVQPYPYDPGKAKALLAEAGLPNGFEFDWQITDGVFLKDREIAEAVANQLKQVGITANLRVTERATIFDNMYSGNFDVTSGQWSLNSEPERYLLWLFVRLIVDPDKDVIGPILDDMKEAVQIVDPVKRAAKYVELNKLAREKAVLMELHVQDELYGVNTGLNWTPAPMRGSGGHLWYALHPSIPR